MPTDQAIFYRSIREMIALTANPLLLDQAPAETVHNRRAAILRHGLRVCSFSSLETYFKDRISDILAKFVAVGFPFSTFSNELQSFLIVDGVMGLANTTGFLPKANRLAYVDQNLRDISTFASSTPTLTAFGFSPKGSNVSSQDVSSALKSFHVDGPWAYMTAKSNLFGGGTSNLKDIFESIARDRHTSAHNPNSQVPTADLQEHLRSVSILGITFDTALGKIVRALSGATDFATFKMNVAIVEPTIRFLDERIDGRWDERTTSAGRSLKIHSSEQSGITAASQRPNVDMVVIRDVQKRPIAAKN